MSGCNNWLSLDRWSLQRTSRGHNCIIDGWSPIFVSNRVNSHSSTVNSHCSLLRVPTLRGERVSSLRSCSFRVLIMIMMKLQLILIVSLLTVRYFETRLAVGVFLTDSSSRKEIMWIRLTRRRLLLIATELLLVLDLTLNYDLLCRIVHILMMALSLVGVIWHDWGSDCLLMI